MLPTNNLKAISKFPSSTVKQKGFNHPNFIAASICVPKIFSRRNTQQEKHNYIISVQKTAFDFEAAFVCVQMEYPVVVGAGVAAAALGTRYLIVAWQAFKARPPIPRMRRFYPGGFERAMTRREAALILGVREHVVLKKIKEAHRRVMVANHPDSGGSHYLASKINEAKDVMLKKTKPAGSVF